MIKKVQEHVDRFSEEINKSKLLSLERIVVKEGEPFKDSAILMTTTKGTIFVHNLSYPYPNGALEHYVLHELSHRVVDNIKPNINLDLTYKVAFGMQTIPQKRDRFEALVFAIGRLNSSFHWLKMNPAAPEVAKSLTEGIAEYFSLIILPSSCCSISSECKKFGRKRAVDFLLEAKKIAIFDESAASAEGRGLETVAECFELDTKTKMKQLQRGTAAYNKRFMDYKTMLCYSLGFNFYFKMVQQHGLGLLLDFLKEPSKPYDPELDFGNLINPPLFLYSLAKNRNLTFL